MEGSSMTRPSIFRDTMAENVKNLRTWHQEHHHAASWADCVHSPCNVTTANFRRCWDVA